MTRESAQIAIVLCLLGLIDVNSATALQESTHEIVNEQASRHSQLDQFLKAQLGFPKGIEEPVRGREGERLVVEWIREGGRREDDVGAPGGLLLRESRFFRHFHDPLYQADGSGRGSWDEAGLRFLGQHESSVLWMQRLNQDAQAEHTGNFSWQNARQYFLAGLTKAAPEEREDAFALTFRALGQVMHLLVDASVPEHVRNDPHPGGFFFGNYEYWVQAQHGRSGSQEEQNFINTFLLNPFALDTSILQQPTNDSLAPVPIARLIDTDTYQGTNPNVTLGAAIGIAEFANANFFSEDTGDGQYPFPNINTLIPTQRQTVQTGRIRAYYKKAPGDGVEVDPVLAECILDELAVSEALAVSRIGTCTDENVWAQIAQLMLPRATSYAGGVLDYFFRGRLDVATDSSRTELRVTNRSSEAIGPGTLSVYCDDANGNRTKLDEMTVTQEVQTDAEFPRIPLSFPAGTLRCIVVYEGKLGEEADAVIGKVFQLGIRPVARTGDAIPGGGTFGTFFFGRPTVNEAGEIIFNGVFADNQTEGIFLESQEVLQPPLVRAGDAAPGGGTFGFFGSLGLDDQGTVSFWGAVGTPSNLISGVFLAPPGGQFQTLALPGDPATGSCGTTFTDFLFDSVSINNQGEVAFIGDFLSNSIPPCFDGLFIAVGGSVRKVAQQSDHAPGGGSFRLFFNDRTTTMNDVGEIAFSASVSGAPSGLFLADGQPVSLVRSGDLAPGGGTFTSVRDPSLNNAGTVAFRGVLGSTTEGIFLRSSTGQLTAVARTGDPAPGGGRFASFGHPAINNLGVIVFTARMDDLSEGVFRYANGTITALARTGDLPLGGGTFDRFLGLSATEGPAINDAGQVVFLAILADGRRGVFVAEPTTLPTQIP